MCYVQTNKPTEITTLYIIELKLKVKLLILYTGAVYNTRPAYRDVSIYRSTLILASVHVILLVGFTAVIFQWALDFSEIFLNLCMLYSKFYSNKFLIWQSLILKKKLYFLNFLK